MKAKVITILQHIRWESELKIGGVSFVPIIGELENYSTGIDIGGEEIDSINVSELESESVNQVNIESEYNGKVLIIAGMILMGGRQTRSPTRPFIINNGSKFTIPVNCIEQGRWAYTPEDAVDIDAKKFKVMKRMVSRKTKSSYSGGGMTQSNTWGNISGYMDEMDISADEAPTQSYIEVEKKIKEKSKGELNEIREKIKSVFNNEKQRGILIFENGELTDIEVFDNPEYWIKVSDQMIEANLIDVLRMKMKEEKKSNRNQVFDQIILKSMEPVADEISYKADYEGKHGWAIMDTDNLVYFNLSKQEDQKDGSYFDPQVQYQTNMANEAVFD